MNITSDDYSNCGDKAPLSSSIISSLAFQGNIPIYGPVNKAVNVKASDSLFEEVHLVSPAAKI